MNHTSASTASASRASSKKPSRSPATSSPPAAKERKQLNHPADLVQVHELEGESYDPSEDGFVFSDDEIQQVLALRDRADRAHEAHDYLKEAA